MERTATASIERAYEGYAPEDERPPLLGYLTFAVVYNAGLGAYLTSATRRRRLPERIEARDLALVGLAGHKLARLISKEKVTAFLRAPFVELEGSGGPGELDERPRGSGLRRVLGESLSCPYCLGLWIVTAMLAGLVEAPRQTRFLTSAFGALAVADFLQIAYKAAEQKGLGD